MVSTVVCLLALWCGGQKFGVLRASTKASINFGFFEIELFPDGLGWGEGVPEQHLHAPECEAQVKSRSVNTQTTVTFRRDYNVPSFAPPPPAMVSEVEVDKSLMQQS